MMYSVTKIWGLKGPPLQTEEIDEDLGLYFIIHSVLVYKKLWGFFSVYLAVFYNSHFSLARFLILIRPFLKRSRFSPWFSIFIFFNILSILLSVFFFPFCIFLFYRVYVLDFFRIFSFFSVLKEVYQKLIMV